MDNQIIKALVYNKQVRLFLLDNTTLLQDIFSMSIQHSNILLKTILGKAISAGSIISGSLKGDQRISFILTMSNPKHQVFVDADAKGNVRGYLSNELLSIPAEEMKYLTLEQLIGQRGFIRVIRGSAMNQFTGITDMPFRNIIDDFSHYFNQSEQTPTYLGANIVFDSNENVVLSKSVYAQLLPGASIHLLDKIQNAFKDKNDRWMESTMEKVLSELFEDAEIIGTSPVQFFCGCTKEMFYGMLHSLNREELQITIARKEFVETVCHICGKTYSFDQNDIKILLDRI